MSEFTDIKDAILTPTKRLKQKDDSTNLLNSSRFFSANLLLSLNNNLSNGAASNKIKLAILNEIENMP